MAKTNGVAIKAEAPAKTADPLEPLTEASAKLGLMHGIISAPYQHMKDKKVCDSVIRGTVQLYQSLGPKNALESILGGLIVNVSNAANYCLSLAANVPPEDLQHRDLNLRHAFKGATVVTQLVDALERVRGARPNVTVGNVNVEPGGQAIVGTVNAAPRGSETVNTETAAQPSSARNSAKAKKKTMKALPLVERHKRKTGPMLSSLRCGAKTRMGTRCRSPAISGKKRCRMHGGAHGSGAPKGNQNALKNGNYTREALQTRAFLRQQIREAKKLLKKLED
jgi:glucans biosynthesis protein